MTSNHFHRVRFFRRLLPIVALVLIANQALATWSIIMIDPKTHEIGIAGASCSYNCYGIGTIIPGKGAVIVQAMSNSEARYKGTQMIIANASPEEIINAMRDPSFDPENQQYAVITVKYIDDARTYTGKTTHTFNGSITAPGISIQGNTLATETELQEVMSAIEQGKKESLSMPDLLMKALEAGSNAGGDKRCGEQKATSAFIMISKPDSKKLYLNLSIFGQAKGKQNAVELLRKRYDRWRAKN